MAGFTWLKSLAGERDPFAPKMQIAASTTVTKGELLKFSSGKLTQVGATDSAVYLAEETATSTSTSLTKINVKRVNNAVLKVNHTPLVNGVAANSNATTTRVKCALTDGSSSDLVGGFVHCVELNETRIITANTYSSNVVTIDVAEAFSRAVTTGDTLRVTAFGFGDLMKGDSSTPASAIGSARGDEASGKFLLYDIVTSGPAALKELHVICT